MPLPDDKILDWSTETNCRRHFKVHLTNYHTCRLLTTLKKEAF